LSRRQELAALAYDRYIAYCELVGVEALDFDHWEEIDRRVFGAGYRTQIS